MVTRHINFLEVELAVKLLQRNTRNISITDAGRQYYRHCIAILDALEEAEAEIGELTQQPKGNLRISVPMDFGCTHLVPIMARFNRLYPDVHLDIDFSDKRVDLTESGIDIAIRGGALGGDQFVAKPLSVIRSLVCASPAYIEAHGLPKVPEDLKQHNCLLYTNSASTGRWDFQKQGQYFQVQVMGSLQANNGGALTRLAVAGVGVIRQPDFLVEKYLESGELLLLLEDFGAIEGRFYAVYPQRKFLSRKTRLLVDFLTEHLSA